MERYNPKDDPEPESKAYRVKPFNNPTPEVNVGFHGTNREIQGGQLRPDIGREKPMFSFSGKRHVNYWTSPNGARSDEAEKDAWSWGQSTPGGDDPADPSYGRPRVVAVRARGFVGMDPNLSDDADVSAGTNLSKVEAPIPVAATHADVTDTEWIPPQNYDAARDGVGVQGTLPHMNWNQFGLPNVGNPQNAHHSYPRSKIDSEVADAHVAAQRDAREAARKKPEPKQEIPGQGSLF